MNEIITYAVGTAITIFAGGTIRLLFAVIKKNKYIQALHVEKLLDSFATTAVNYAEAWGMIMRKKGTAKMKTARELFEKHLAVNKIKMTPEEATQRLESLLNQLKPDLESGETRPIESDSFTGKKTDKFPPFGSQG